MCTIVYVDEAQSTNTMMSQHAATFGHGNALVAHTQTAGRGQRGNSWESEPCKNLTFSVMLRPSTIVASHQFELSQIVSIAMVKVLRELLDTEDVCIKWPNDIYYRDLKLSGILIENSITGTLIDRSIVGIGLNVNQKEFLSDAPNPVSMANIAGKEFDLDTVLDKLLTQIVNDFDAYEQNVNPTLLAGKYRYMLWRGEGYHPYRDTATGEVFDARIAAIAPTGMLTLATKAGAFRTYAFKEVASIL